MELVGAQGRRVLIVDDDRLLAETLREMISDLGGAARGGPISVEVVTSGREAARHLATEPVYDAILCDLGMPGVDGLTLFEGLVARGSALARRFVLITGGAFTPGAADAIARAGVPCLQKPFDAARLAAVLRPWVSGLA